MTPSLLHREVREVLDFRTLSILKDDNEFRRIQTTLRDSKVSTEMGALQLLDQCLADDLAERGICLTKKEEKIRWRRESQKG